MSAKQMPKSLNLVTLDILKSGLKKNNYKKSRPAILNNYDNYSRQMDNTTESLSKKRSTRWDWAALSALDSRTPTSEKGSALPSLLPFTKD
jgi:hypothetical protein